MCRPTSRKIIVSVGKCTVAIPRQRGEDSEFTLVANWNASCSDIRESSGGLVSIKSHAQANE